MKKIFNVCPVIMLFIFFMNLISCSNNKLINSVNQPLIIPTKKKVELTDINNGDLIFIGTTNKDLSGAINRVTQIKMHRNYDHVGLIEKSNDSVFVLHAAPKGGSQREEIHQFYKNQKVKFNEIIVYRLYNHFQYTIPDAIITAKSLLGKAYNWEYILNDETLYCSDFIERSFRKDSIFELIPMNFKNPNTGKFDDFWIDYYREKNIKIPQDEPGTNPNQLAESEKLVEIGPLFIKNK